MESLVQSFHMLKYGIAAILVLIGRKDLIASGFGILGRAGAGIL